jgi:hypothetical protein
MKLYISVISTIIYCFMPILYNIHILLATIYMIYWTNILIQCPVHVPVCCTFFVLQNTHIKRSPNTIKIYGELFWNICDFLEMESTQTEAHGHHHPPGRAWQAKRGLVGCALLEHWLELYFRHKEAYIRKKIVLKSECNRSYGSPDI